MLTPRVTALTPLPTAHPAASWSPLRPAAHGDGEPGAAITVVVADDHAVVRRGVRAVLESGDDRKVVAEAADIADALRMVRMHRPGVLVLDLNMPGGSSLQAIPAIHAASPHTTIVVLTMQDDPTFAGEALRAGALGYVLKEATDDDLVDAVRAASAGHTYLPERLVAALAG